MKLESRLLWASGLFGFAIVAALAITPSSPRADVIDPSMAKTIAIGDGGALAPCAHANAAHNGRVVSLPILPKPRWQQKLGARIEHPIAVASDGTVVVVTSPGSGGLESALLDLSPSDGVSKHTFKIDSPVAAAPIVLSNGLRVVVTMRGEAIGVDAGVQRFRTSLGGEFASVQRVALVPLPNGGFAIARRPELIEVDGAGAIVGRTRFELPSSPSLAIRRNGDILAVTPTGELHTWRANRLPRLLGTFGEKDKPIGSGGQVCQWGPVIDDDPINPTSGRRERAICVSDSLVEAIDLGNGTRRALMAKTFIPFRSPAAVGVGGEVVLTSAGGAAMGIGSTGVEFGPIDLPGITTIVPTTKDAGSAFFFSSTGGEVAPLIGSDGSILYGSSDGLAIVRSGNLPIRVPRCGGGATSLVAGLAPAGPSAVAIAFGDGCVELVTDAAVKEPKK